MTLTLLDLVVVWGVPLVGVACLYLVISFGLYLLVSHPTPWSFKYDIENKIHNKQALPSGKTWRLSYLYFLGLLTLDNGIQATLLYRLSHSLACRRLHPLAEAVHSCAKFLTHIDISPYAEIGPGILFYHGSGIVIGKFSRLGRRVTVCQNVTTGAGRPHIGDDVTLWAGAVVLGNVTIGPRAEIGANAVVLNDIPPDCIAVGVPAKRLLPKTPPAQNGAPAVQNRDGDYPVPDHPDAF